MKHKIIACVALVLAIGICFFLSAINPARPLNAYRRSLVAAGEKLELSDWIPPRPAGSNGAPELLAIGEEVVRLQPLRVDSFWADALSRPRYVASLEKQSRTFEPLRRRLENALAMPVIDFGWDFRTNSIGATPRFAVSRMFNGMEPLADLFKTDILFHLHQGNDPFDELRLMLLLQRRTEGFVLPEFQRRRAPVLEMCWSTTWNYLQSTNLTESKLAQLQKDWEGLSPLKAIESIAGIKRAQLGLEFDKARHKAVRTAFRSFTCQNLTTLSSPFWTELKWAARKSYSEEREMLEVSSLEVDTDRSYLKSHSVFETAPEFQRKMGLVRTQNGGVGFAGYRVGVDFPSFDILRTAVPAENRRQVMITALALYRYRLQHGAFPAQLAEITPAFLAEPPRYFGDGKFCNYSLDSKGRFEMTVETSPLTFMSIMAVMGERGGPPVRLWPWPESP